MNTSRTEETLLVRLRHNDETALLEIYNQFWKPLFLSAYNVLKEKQACEDILQDVFLHLWQNRNSLFIHTSLQAYLYTAVRFQVLKQLRKTARQDQYLNNLETRVNPISPIENLEEKETRNRIHSVVATLPRKCRQVYFLSREQYLSHKEIAAAMNISPKTVENQLTIALKKIRQALNRFSALLF